MPNEKEQGHKAEGTCDGSGEIDLEHWSGMTIPCGGCSNCSPKKGEEKCECDGEHDFECRFKCHNFGDDDLGHPEAKAGEWLTDELVKLCRDGGWGIGDLFEEVMDRHLTQAEQRGRLSGINEMASRGRENIKRVIGSPAVWCFEEVCKDRTCPTCKAGWKFQNDIEPAIYASLEKALKDLSQ